MGTQQNLANTAQTASGTLQKLLGTQIDLSKAPAAGKAPTMQTVGSGPQLQTSVAGGGDIRNSYGPTDYSADRSKVEQAIMDRAQGGIDNDRRALEQRLADQGIAIGSAAYQSAMDDHGRSVNDMRTSAILAGGQEQSRLAGLAQQQATFQNAAQQQQWSQNLQGAAFGNDARNQQFQNTLAGTGFNNNAAAQTFDGQNAARSQYLNEAYANRNQSLNEILGLMNGSQVQSPNFVNTSQNQIANTDIAGLIQQNYANKLAGYNSQGQLFKNLAGGIQGLFGLGG